METSPPPIPSPLPPLPAPSASSDKALAILCHVSSFIGMAFLLPFIIFLVKRDESPFVAAHAREVLNFHLSLLIYCICLIPFIFILIAIPIYIVLAIMAFICAIIGAIRAADGAFYFYPLTIRFI